MKKQNSIIRPWSSEVDEIFESLVTGQQGLSETEAVARLEVYGTNIFRGQEKKSAFGIFLKQLANPLIFILISAAIVTGILGEWIEVVVIAFAVLVNAGLGFYREYHAEHTLEKLVSFIKERTRVIRDGYETEIDAELLVPGDVIKLAYGARVPADARIIRTTNVRIDEAVLTGESAPVQKDSASVAFTATIADRTSMLHAGTLIVDGFVLGVVTTTGNDTEIGKIARLVSSTQRATTPIQKGMSKIAWIIFGVVLLIIIGIFILGVWRGESISEMLILSVAVSVGAVPEALPIALTVILSIGAERIAKKRGIVRTLIAAETLGSTSLIMTDKTGTLTEANMQLVGIHTDASILEGVAAGSAETNALLQMALANIDVVVENPLDPIESWTFLGKPFEVNIVRIARDKGIDVSHLKSTNSSSIVIPFNSTHKFSLSVSAQGVVVMGAPDVLLSRSTMDAKSYNKLEAWIAKASSEGNRLIAVGVLPSPVSSVSEVQHVECRGILAFHDPVRKEVPDAIKKIESLGIKVVMVTGDLKGTAIAVARELGWDVHDSQVVTGQDLATLSDAALLDIISSIKIFARVTPEDKLRIGRLYRSCGEVVAMTGDGVNDAPSLKAMDIGIALGSGSDVAKSAADLVLLDDNFKTISLSVQEGRRILANIRKTFVYLMSNSLDVVFVIGGSLLFGMALPLTALQIIWVNLFTGSLPALAFAYDEDFDHDTARTNTIKSIFTKEVNLLTYGIGTATSLLLFVVYYALLSVGVELSLARSVFFVCFASYILVIAFSFRSLHKSLFSYPIFSNRKLNQSILIATIFIIATMCLPVLRNLFGLAPLPLVWLWFVSAWLIVNILLVESAKYFFRNWIRTT